MFMLDKLRALVKRYLIIFNGKIFWNVYPFSLEHWPDIKCIPFNHFYMEPWPDLKCISLFSGILVIPCWSPNKHQSKWQIICRTVHYMQWLNKILQKKMTFFSQGNFTFTVMEKKTCTTQIKNTFYLWITPYLDTLCAYISQVFMKSGQKLVF